ncbi:ribulokinase [Lentisphaera profundi]|uniref:Ribulokinase n=1 Tax=Lentisphaera profundi TaxID=1658616 RepID=A0ABY7W2T6_9BACT|nr:ribulokinase [Lentisphaera profundi]WDE99432.1 ribulokinase [Lentisphaera profundi]
MKEYVIGLDYGTNSCRAVLVEVGSNEELFSEVYPYPSGNQGVLLSAQDPHLARQSPADYLNGMQYIIKSVIEQAQSDLENFEAKQVIALTCATTGSTVIPVDKFNQALGLLEPRNLNAQAWLWKDHTSHNEAAIITAKAKEMRPQMLEPCGGTYSSEWFWAKILRLKNIDPETFGKAYSFVELCDFLPGALAGVKDPKELKRSICAAGHKAIYADEWGGLPDKEFLNALDPELSDLRDRLYDKALESDQVAGHVCESWAKRTGLAEGTVIAVGAFDAHMGAVGAGIKEGALVKIVGTSTCDLMISKSKQAIAGVCGVVEGSVIPGFVGIEAGQSAVGDLFLWLVNHLGTSEYGNNRDEIFKNMTEQAAAMSAGQSGLLSLDWNNGNRCTLVDMQLSGLMLGQTLHSKVHEIYRALIEATAFGALKIIERLEDSGTQVEEIICCGGLAQKNKLMMQIYANVFNRPVRIADSDQTCALGAAIFAAAASKKLAVLELQKQMTTECRREYLPELKEVQTYGQLYEIYSQLYEAFGVEGSSDDLFGVMKRLIKIQQEVNRA